MLRINKNDVQSDKKMQKNLLKTLKWNSFGSNIVEEKK